MPYTPQSWSNGSGGGTPLSAARLNAMETGIQRASPAAVSSTSLPGSPFDGQEVFYAASATDGIYWHLRYRSASASPHKWEGVGPPLLHEVDTAETLTAQTTYSDLATVGPQITIPLAGDYLIRFGAHIHISSFTAARTVMVTVKLGAAAASDTDAIDWRGDTGNQRSANNNEIRVNGLAASAVLKMMYRITTASDTISFKQRYLSVTPIRVS